MTIALTLQKYLDQNVRYDVMVHEPTMSSLRTAEACHISGNCLAKGIVLRHNGGYVLAVLPASHHLNMTDLRAQIGEDVALADEADLDHLFRDCVHGAVPPVGECYGLEVIVDDSVEAQPDIRTLMPLLEAVPNETGPQCIPFGTASPMLFPLVSNALYC